MLQSKSLLSSPERIPCLKPQVSRCSIAPTASTSSPSIISESQKLAYGWRVRVRCPGCGNIVEVVMLAYTLIHGRDPDKYKPGETLEILPPDPNPSPEWRMAVNKLRMEILQKKTGWRPQGT